MFKYVLFAALLAFASAKPKPLVVEYDYPVAYSAPVAAYSAYTAPVAYSYSAYDYALPYSAYAYSPYSYYVR
ncbi:hypothetical protein HF086_009431 [Spodoptera exigua]|uniref:Uncharacterized protein n=1 Tax=Spodoptera exigua TaxID=7107 RepID=A0A922MFG7_SPOEX|nr:hypothetical protein HF086_009431 [Spodoptera exigua]